MKIRGVFDKRLNVFILFILLLIVGIPVVLSFQDQAKEKAYQAVLSEIETSARLFVTGSTGSFSWQEEDGHQVIYVLESTLKDRGYLDKKIVDPRNDKELTDFVVRVRRIDNQNQYQVLLDYYHKLVTDEFCFQFDQEKRMIVGYSNSCPKDVVVPSHIKNLPVEVIGENALAFKDFTSVILPYGLKKIEKNAFRFNRLTQIEIPSSVFLIESAAFNGNQLVDLDALIYGRNNDGSENKKQIVSYGGTRDSFTIPPTVSIIDDSAFEGSPVTSIFIPNSVTQIGSRAFATFSLTNVSIQGKTVMEQFTVVGEAIWGENTPIVQFVS